LGRAADDDAACVFGSWGSSGDVNISAVEIAYAVTSLEDLAVGVVVCGCYGSDLVSDGHGEVGAGDAWVESVCETVGS